MVTHSPISKELHSKNPLCFSKNHRKSMAPSILLLLRAMFSCLVLLMATYHRIVDSTSTTLAISQATSTVCGIYAGSQQHSIECPEFQESAELNGSFQIDTTLSINSIPSGPNFIYQLIKCVFFGPMVLSETSVGSRHLKSIHRDWLNILCWRSYGCNCHARPPCNFPTLVYGESHSLTSGEIFTCGIYGAYIVPGWGSGAKLIQRNLAGVQMRRMIAGGGPMCGLNMTGDLICTGKKLNVQSGEAFEFTSFAIRGSHTCAIRRINWMSVCWGRYGSYFPMGSTGFEFLAAGGNLTSGLTTGHFFNGACWGLNGTNRSVSMKILPGGSLPDETFHSCGLFHYSGNLCRSGFICTWSDTGTKDFCPISVIIEMPHASSQGKWWFVYVIFGIVFAILGIGMNVCYKWLKLRQKKNKCIPTEITLPALNNVKVFSFNELKNATNNFSKDSLLGCGGFGIVYRGQLSDGRLVAVKLSYTTNSGWESCFKAELETLATTCHVNVVNLIGYCTESNESLCVFEFMPNKDLHRHIHPRNWQMKSTTMLFYFWKLRLKVLLDAARGIEHLHQYAKPRIIHRDIKSSNILIDEKWNAKISDFGLAVFGPEAGRDHVDVAAVIGTAGYLDPDCDPYFPCVTQQNDVYSFGVVMLEMITGRMAYNTSDETQLVPSAAPKIASGNLMEVLDKRLAVPVGCKMEAVQIVAQLALQCTQSGLQRPNMSEVVKIIESAVALFN